MMSGRSTVVVAWGDEDVEEILEKCCERLDLEDDGGTMELWHGSDKVPDDGTEVKDWPGVQSRGEISEYDLVIRRDESSDSSD
eukprot:3145246-Amphidinium_carterae.1